MILTTNYVAAAKAFNDAVYRVRISRSAPFWCPVDDEIKPLFPGEALLSGYKSGIISEDEYVQTYLAQLSKKEDVIRGEIARVKAAAGDRAILLLCWCGKNRFCHRKVFSAWWQHLTGEEIREL